MIFVSLFGYLIWHLIYSNKGAISLFRLSSQKERLNRENQTLDKDRKNLEKRVNKMKSNSLDLDMLDEQARKNLGYGKNKETIYVD